ncbi:hypothetical protein SK128_001641, partial [Halocaridina rubra]
MVEMLSSNINTSLVVADVRSPPSSSFLKTDGILFPPSNNVDQQRTPSPTPGSPVKKAAVETSL